MINVVSEFFFDEGAIRARFMLTEAFYDLTSDDHRKALTTFHETINRINDRLKADGFDIIVTAEKLYPNDDANYLVYSNGNNVLNVRVYSTPTDSNTTGYFVHIHNDWEGPFKSLDATMNHIRKTIFGCIPAISYSKTAAIRSLERDDIKSNWTRLTIVDVHLPNNISREVLIKQNARGEEQVYGTWMEVWPHFRDDDIFS